MLPKRKQRAELNSLDELQDHEAETIAWLIANMIEQHLLDHPAILRDENMMIDAQDAHGLLVDICSHFDWLREERLHGETDGEGS
jgi:hypothetical protein